MKVIIDGKEEEIGIRKVGDIYKYYLNGVNIGVYSPDRMEEKILFKDRTLKDEVAAQIKDQLNGLNDREIEEQAEPSHDEKEEELERDYRNMTEFDLDEEFGKKEENEHENKEVNNEKEEKIREEEKTITTREVNIKEESELSESVDGIKTLRNWIGGNIPSEYKKIGIIESEQSDKFKDENGNRYTKHGSRYDLVLIDNKGNVKPLKEFVDVEQSSAHGTNPNSLEKGEVQVENDGTANNANKDYKNSGSTVLSLPNGKYLSIGMKEHGDIALYAGKEQYDSREFASVQVRGKNDAFESNREERESVIGYYEGQHSSDEASKEAQIHKTIDGEECDKKEWKDVNGEPDKSHIHIKLDEKFLEKATEVMLNDDEITANVYNSKEVKLKIIERLEEEGYEMNKVYDENDVQKIKEIMKEVNEDVEERAEGQRTLGNKT